MSIQNANAVLNEPGGFDQWCADSFEADMSLAELWFEWSDMHRQQTWASNWR
jgi:hypothetical protein